MPAALPDPGDALLHLAISMHVIFIPKLRLYTLPLSGGSSPLMKISSVLVRVQKV
jgi:hypothetical protein